MFFTGLLRYVPTRSRLHGIGIGGIGIGQLRSGGLCGDPPIGGRERFRAV
jgi:hypothetical protein